MAAEIDWPEYFPKAVLLDGFQNTPSAAVDRMAMDSGRSRQRLMGAPPETARVPVAWLMDGVQLCLFKQWIRADAVFGQVFFNIDLNLGAGEQAYEARFLPDVELKYSYIGPGERGSGEHLIFTGNDEHPFFTGNDAAPFFLGEVLESICIQNWRVDAGLEVIEA